MEWWCASDVCCCKLNTTRDCDEHLDKLAQVQVVIKCRYSVAQMCTLEDTLAHNLGAPYFVRSMLLEASFRNKLT